MIRSVSDSEEGAFDLFFVLLEEFTNRKARLVARIHQDGSGEATDLVTYTDDPGFFTLEPDEFGRTRFYSDLDFVRIFEGGDIEVLDEEGFRQARGD